MLKPRHRLFWAILLTSIGLSGPLPLFAQTEAELRYQEAFKSCTPSTHLLPSIVSLFLGIDLIHRGNIQGYQGQNCVIDYTFATLEKPKTEVSYLRCAYPPEIMTRLIAMFSSQETMNVADYCQMNSNWLEQLDLQPGRSLGN